MYVTFCPFFYSIVKEIMKKEGLLLWLVTSDRSLESFNEIKDGLKFTDYRPMPEDIESVKDDWVVFDGGDWMVEFVGERLIYYAEKYRNEKLYFHPYEGLEHQRVVLDLAKGHIYDVAYAPEILVNGDLVPNRYSPIIYALFIHNS